MHRLGLHRVDGSGKGELILMYVRAIRLTGKFWFCVTGWMRDDD